MATLGALGLLSGFSRTPHAADAAAVAAGLVMLTVITLYARGWFAPRPASRTTTRPSPTATASPLEQPISDARQLNGDRNGIGDQNWIVEQTTPDRWRDT